MSIQVTIVTRISACCVGLSAGFDSISRRGLRESDFALETLGLSIITGGSSIPFESGPCALDRSIGSETRGRFFGTDDRVEAMVAAMTDDGHLVGSVSDVTGLDSRVDESGILRGDGEGDLVANSLGVRDDQGVVEGAGILGKRRHILPGDVKALVSYRLLLEGVLTLQGDGLSDLGTDFDSIDTSPGAVTSAEDFLHDQEVADELWSQRGSVENNYPASVLAVAAGHIPQGRGHLHDTVAVVTGGDNGRI